MTGNEGRKHTAIMCCHCEMTETMARQVEERIARLDTSEDKPIETMRDHETGARAQIMVDAMPARVRNRLYFMRWMREQEKVIG